MKKQTFKGKLDTGLKSKDQSLMNLVKEVENSKLAVQNITPIPSKRSQTKFGKQLDSLRSTLEKCMSQLQTQMKRQFVLSELISILKGEMSLVQNKQKKIQQIEDIQFERKKNRLRYDIDKIYQKKNQEIAKIKKLKILTNSSRSQRVVYSNLFRKLESELKMYEDMYIDFLTEVENKKLLLMKFPYQDKQISTKKAKIEIKSPETEETLITQPPEQICEKKIQKTVKVRLKRGKAKSYFGGYSNNENYLENHRQQIIMEIEKMRNFFNQIQVYTSCENTEEIINTFCQVQLENDVLKSEIDQINLQIDQLESQKVLIEKKKNFHSCFPQQIVEKSKINLQLFDQDQMGFCIFIPGGGANRKFQLAKNIVKDIFRIFEFEERDINLSNQALQTIGLIIDQITEPIFPSSHSKLFHKQSKMTLDFILNSVQTSEPSDRIFDRVCFEADYLREVSKRKKSMRVKKTKSEIPKMI